MPKKKTKKKRSTVKDAAISADLASAIVERLEINADFEAGSDTPAPEKRISIKKTSAMGFTKFPDPELQQVIKESHEILPPVSGGAWC